MMKLLNVFFLFTTFISCGQVTTTTSMHNYSFEFSNGTYFKDLNDELLPYLGTWEGTLNNRKYTFEFVKFTQYLTTSVDGKYYYIDEIKVKFKVVDLAANQILYDDLQVTNYSDYKISGLAIGRKTFSLLYQDPQNCHNSAGFRINKIPGQPDKLKYLDFRYDSYFYFDCPNYQTQEQIPMFLPLSELILTKV